MENWSRGFLALIYAAYGMRGVCSSTRFFLCPPRGGLPNISGCGAVPSRHAPAPASCSCCIMTLVSAPRSTSGLASYHQLRSYRTSEQQGLHLISSSRDVASAVGSYHVQWVCASLNRGRLTHPLLFEGKASPAMKSLYSEKKKNNDGSPAACSFR